MTSQERAAFWNGIYLVRVEGRYLFTLRFFCRIVGPLVIGQPVVLQPVTDSVRGNKYFWRRQRERGRGRAKTLVYVAKSVKVGYQQAGTLICTKLPK